MSDSTVHPGEEFFRRVTLAATLARRHAEKVLAPFRLTVAEYTLLRIVRNTPNLTARAAGKRMYSTAPSVAQLVKSIESKGLIARTASNSDARVQYISLTARGKTLAEKAYVSVIREQRALDINERDLTDTSGNLSRIIDSLSTSLPSYGHA